MEVSRALSGEETLTQADYSDAAGRHPEKDASDSEACPEDLSEVMDFSSYDLMTTIRLIVLSGESRRVDVKRGSRWGSIYIKAGEIYRVVADQRQGDAAFFEIISWDRAVHKDNPESTVLEGNMRISTNVLLQSMRNQVYQK